MTDDSDELRERILGWLASPKFRPMGKSELARFLSIPSGGRAQFRAVLYEMERDGLLERRKGARFGPAGAKPDVARGIFETTPKGRHSVRLLSGARAVPPGPDGTRRVDVPPQARGLALHGDFVEIRIRRRVPSDRPPRGGRPQSPRWSATDPGPEWEARVLSVIDEGRRATTGILRGQGRSFVIESTDPRFPPFLTVAGLPPGTPPQPGDLVLARVIEWSRPNLPPLARIERTLGAPDSPGNAMRALIHRMGLPEIFPEAVLAEAEALPDTVDPGDLAGRDDWRDRLVVTIDPSDARDFDDAIHVQRQDTGWLLAVHIADVSHYIRPGSALDAEALQRGNSVYLADRVLPMLPEKISNGLCSLVPGEDRLTRLALLSFNHKGNLVKAVFKAAVIRSQRRLSYEEAQAILQDPAATGPVAAMLKEAWNLAALLRRRRFEAGALDLDFPEVKVMVDASGVPTGIRKIVHDASHQLIEEFMLAANEAVARTTREAALPCIYRIHEDPDEAKLWEFRELARLHGFSPPPGPGRGPLQALLQAIRGHPCEHPLKLALLKSLRRAAYAAEPRGHYGLAKANYLHFTSPIRRYADLVAHRVIGKWHGHQPVLPCPTPPQSTLAETAAHISLSERFAADAEWESRRLMEIEYFAGLLASRSTQAFSCIVTEATRSGLFIELDDIQVRGLIPAAAFPPGDWWFDAQAACWRQSRVRSSFHPGSRLTVRIRAVDRENRFLDFSIV